MRLPSRISMIMLLFFIVACSILLSWIAGFYTPGNATFRDWYQLIAAIVIVACVLGYFIIKRFRSPRTSWIWCARVECMWVCEWESKSGWL